MKAILIALLVAGGAAAHLADPLARFSYSGDFARRMNGTYGAAEGSLFVVDDIKGRDLAETRLLGAIQALIRVFPGCGNRQLQFAYAYGEAADTRIVAFRQTAKRAPECPGTAIVAVSTVSNAVTVRSFPDA